MWTMLAMIAASGPSTAPSADLQTLFQLMDRNRDGFITSEETPRVSNVRSQAAPNVIVRSGTVWIARYDRDGDSRVSRNEFFSGAQAELAAYPG